MLTNFSPSGKLDMKSIKAILRELAISLFMGSITFFLSNLDFITTYINTLHLSPIVLAIVGFLMKDIVTFFRKLLTDYQVTKPALIGEDLDLPNTPSQE